MTLLQEKVLSLNHVLSPGDTINLAMRMLNCMNREVTSHSFKTAYIALYISKFYNMHEDCSVRNLILLSLFHTLGFFHEEIQFNYSPYSSNIDYFSEEKPTESKYVFASYYLEYMTPLGQDARGIAAFSSKYNKNTKLAFYQEDYKNIIYLAAKIGDFVTKNPDKDLPSDLNELAPDHFDPLIVRAFIKAQKIYNLVENIKNDHYQSIITGYLYELKFTQKQTKQLEMLLIYFIDFKSTCTMKHCINTSCFAFAIGTKMKLNHQELSSLFTSALLHDIGKMATPQRILEFPGRLTPEDMGIMRYHVNHSKRLLTGFVPDDILQNVYRHHEKLNGSGYPSRTPGEEISLIQRVLTAADITSALNDSRSYKTEFTKEQTIEILQEMTDKGELDPKITKIICDNFDELLVDLKELQHVLKVDFSQVLSHYNTYLFNDFAEDPALDIELEEELEPIEDLEEV